MQYQSPTICLCDGFARRVSGGSLTLTLTLTRFRLQLVLGGEVSSKPITVRLHVRISSISPRFCLSDLNSSGLRAAPLCPDCRLPCALEQRHLADTAPDRTIKKKISKKTAKSRPVLSMQLMGLEPATWVEWRPKLSTQTTWPYGRVGLLRMPPKRLDHEKSTMAHRIFVWPELARESLL